MVEGQQCRFVGTAEKPEWIAQDVCNILGLSDVSSTLADFDTDEKGTRSARTLGGKQSMVTVHELGLYRLVFTSLKPDAVTFQ